MRTSWEGMVKYLTYLSVRTLWIAPIHESTIHRIFVACVVLIEVIFTCVNLEPDDCNLATTILVYKLLNYIKHSYCEGFGWYFSDWNGVNVQ